MADCKKYTYRAGFIACLGICTAGLVVASFYTLKGCYGGNQLMDTVKGLRDCRIGYSQSNHTGAEWVALNAAVQCWASCPGLSASVIDNIRNSVASNAAFRAVNSQSVVRQRQLPWLLMAAAGLLFAIGLVYKAGCHVSNDLYPFMGHAQQRLLSPGTPRSTDSTSAEESGDEQAMTPSPRGMV